MAGSFASAVAKWAEKTEIKLTEAWHASLRGLDKEMAGNTPVVTGNLRNSRAVSTAGPLAVNWTTKKFRNPDDAINNAIAGAEVGGVVHLGYQAPYAKKVEDRRAFLRLAVQRWPQIVDEAAKRIAR